MTNEKLYQLALHFAPGIGNYSIKQLISYCGSAEAVFLTSKGKLRKIPGIGPKAIESIANSTLISKAESELKNAEQEGITVLSYTDKAYPNRLKVINDAPAIIYVKGAADLNNQKCIAIVGTRRATTYGKNFTDQLIEALVPHNPLIISGLAYGIDIAAHRSAVKHKLETIAIMASGVDIVYPSVHKDTVKLMTEHGGILSEHKIGTKPEPAYFPARNRIIAGMADAVIVVEAARKGGALITAEIANSYNKDVFALPGAVNSTYSEGCNNLIKSHKAHLITDVEDLEYIMNWSIDIDQTKGEPAFDESAFEGEEKLVVRSLFDTHEGLLLDELSWKTNIPLSKLASILLGLEFKGAVNSLPGKRYKLTK